MTQDEESEIQFPDKDRIDCTNYDIKVDQTNETFEELALDYERVEKENHNETIKSLVERGEKLYTFIGENDDIIDENKEQR